MGHSKLHLKILESRPCSQPWSAMQGNGRERHCESCGKKVYNIASMLNSEIEDLVRHSDGHLCARISFARDGSLDTLNGRSQPSIAARAVLAASLVFPAMAAAQIATDAVDHPMAHVTGRILLPDGSGPMAGTMIRLEVNQQIVAVLRADQQGNFEISANPGIYDIAFGKSPFDSNVIRDANLQAGEQSLGNVRFGDSVTVHSETLYSVSTGGVLVARVRYPFSYLFKHPIRYLKNLPHNF